MPIAFNTVRTGKKYYLRNYGEESRFEVLEITGTENALLKDLLTLEQYYFTDLIKFGKGEDFEFLPL